MMPAIVSPLLARTRALFDGAVTALARECA